jgi:hypothetical protein
MTRAKIPIDGNILVELGQTRPLEVGYDAFSPFQILWVITDGTVQHNFIWITRRESGIYVAFGGPGGLHTSYHTDGTFHWKVEGQSIDLSPHPPLNDLRAPVLIQSATTAVNTETLNSFELTSFTDKPVDRVIYLDNRMLPSALYYHVWLVPPFSHGEVPLMSDHPAHVHLVTHTLPWIEVIIYEQGPRAGGEEGKVTLIKGKE